MGRILQNQKQRTENMSNGGLFYNALTDGSKFYQHSNKLCFYPSGSFSIADCGHYTDNGIMCYKCSYEQKVCIYCGEGDK
jgi:hypothetical protein